MKEYDQAEAAFSEANRLDNTDPTVWAHLSLVNLAQNQRILAEQSYKWALRVKLKMFH
jgi:Tfp pilus assembly protein PilF